MSEAQADLSTYDVPADHPVLESLLNELTLVANDPHIEWGESTPGDGRIVDLQNMESVQPLGKQVHRMWTQDDFYAEMVCTEAAHSTKTLYWSTTPNPRQSAIQSMQVHRDDTGAIWAIKLTTVIDGEKLQLEFRLDHNIVQYFIVETPRHSRAVKSFQDHQIFKIYDHLTSVLPLEV